MEENSNSLIKRQSFQVWGESQLSNSSWFLSLTSAISVHGFTLTPTLCKASRAEQKRMFRHSLNNGGSEISKTQGKDK